MQVENEHVQYMQPNTAGYDGISPQAFHKCHKLGPTRPLGASHLQSAAGIDSPSCQHDNGKLTSQAGRLMDPDCPIHGRHSCEDACAREKQAPIAHDKPNNGVTAQAEAMLNAHDQHRAAILQQDFQGLTLTRAGQKAHAHGSRAQQRVQSSHKALPVSSGWQDDYLGHDSDANGATSADEFDDPEDLPAHMAPRHGMSRCAPSLAHLSRLAKPCLGLMAP